MGTFEQISTIALGMVILDFVSLGFLSYLFRLSYPYRNLLNEGVLLRDYPCSLAPYFHKGGRYRELILTKNHLILRDSWLTASFILTVASIRQYQIKNTLEKKKKVVVLFELDENSDLLSFKTNNSEKWQKVFNELRIEELT